MTKGVQWIKERTSTTLRLIRSNPAFLREDRMAKIIIHHILSLHTTPHTTYTGRCFSQFDRHSGCYRNGAYDCVGRLEAPFSLRSSNSLSREAAVESSYSPNVPVRISDFAPFTVAAWGTQTRLDGSQVKYQPCSQELL